MNFIFIKNTSSFIATLDGDSSKEEKKNLYPSSEKLQNNALYYIGCMVLKETSKQLKRNDEKSVSFTLKTGNIMIMSTMTMRCVQKKIAFYFLFPGSISLILHWTLAFSGFFSFLWAILSVTGTFFFLSLLVSFYRYFFLLYLRCCLQPFDVVLLVLHR